MLTGQEIWDQTDGGQVDAIVVGTGTGGTASGIGRFFQKKGSKTKIIGVDPLGSVHYQIFKTGTLSTPYVYKVEGLGEDIKCEAFDPPSLTRCTVSDYECFTMARRLTRRGLFCGGRLGRHGASPATSPRTWARARKSSASCPTRARGMSPSTSPMSG